MRIISWNVNGIRACSKKGFYEFVRRENPDVLCIQETKAHPDQLDEELKNLFQRVSYFSSAEKKGYSGTATYLKVVPENVSYGIDIRKFDNEGRFVIVQIKDIFIYNIYFPNGASGEERHFFKQEFLNKLSAHLKKLVDKGAKIIVVGDYNVAYLDHDVFDPVRLSSVSGFLPEERGWFKNFLDIGFIDTFRYFNPNLTQKYTWWSYRENARIANRGWRIDHICVTKNLLDRVEDVRILDMQEGSDHCPVLIDLKSQSIE
jgi:exodeoxyribonuclease-3